MCDATEIIVTICFSVLSFSLTRLPGLPPPPFLERDPNFSYPFFKQETVSMRLCILYCTGSALVFCGYLCFRRWFGNDRESKAAGMVPGKLTNVGGKASGGRRASPAAGVAASSSAAVSSSSPSSSFSSPAGAAAAFGALCLNYLQVNFVTLAVTEVLKMVIGRTRPNFYAMCDYAGYRGASLTGNYTLYEEQTKVGAFGDISKCASDVWSEVLTAQRSFPSGHSSWSFATMVWLMLLARASLGLHKGEIMTVRALLVTALPLSLASFIAVSRIRDRWHHTDDVIAGAVLGAVIAKALWEHLIASGRAAAFIQPSNGGAATAAASTSSGAAAAAAAALSDYLPLASHEKKEEDSRSAQSAAHSSSASASSSSSSSSSAAAASHPGASKQTSSSGGDAAGSGSDGSGGGDSRRSASSPRPTTRKERRQ